MHHVGRARRERAGVARGRESGKESALKFFHQIWNHVSSSYDSCLIELLKHVTLKMAAEKSSDLAETNKLYKLLIIQFTPMGEERAAENFLTDFKQHQVLCYFYNLHCQLPWLLLNCNENQIYEFLSRFILAEWWSVSQVFFASVQYVICYGVWVSTGAWWKAILDGWMAIVSKCSCSVKFNTQSLFYWNIKT